jgi:hypothetical protein
MVIIPLRPVFKGSIQTTPEDIKEKSFTIRITP